MNRKKKLQTLAELLLFMGLTLDEFLPVDSELGLSLVVSPVEDIARELATQALVEAGLSTEKEWYAEPDACDYCTELAEASPYPLDAEMDTHPNCRCQWIPYSGNEEPLNYMQ
jgi:hypothetical protein